MNRLFFRLFVDHPASVDESFFQHFCFATRLASRLFLAAAAAFTHGLIPGLCTSTASNLIRELNTDLTGRGPSAVTDAAGYAD